MGGALGGKRDILLYANILFNFSSLLFNTVPLSTTGADISVYVYNMVYFIINEKIFFWCYPVVKNML
jgi:hypothetical protein